MINVMESHQPKQSTVSIDYLRVFLQDAVNRGFPRISSSQSNLVTSWAIRRGEDIMVTPWGLSGFVGAQCASIAVGTRDRDGMIDAKGSAAAWVAELEVARNGRASRIDLALDVDDQDRNLARFLAAQLPAEERRQLKCWLADGLGEGDTLYLGSRSSDRMMRVYDKTAQQGLDPKVVGQRWRYEVELKGDYAAAAWSAIVRGEDAAALWQLHAGAIFGKLGIEPLLPIAADQAVVPPLQQRRLDDPARKLDWILKQVAPALRNLAAVYGRDILDKLIYESEDNNGTT